MKQLRTLKSLQIFKTEIKNQKPIPVDVFSRPIQWYYSHVYPIWPDGTFNAYFCRLYLYETQTGGGNNVLKCHNTYEIQMIFAGYQKPAKL
jgi:hypothetical protein